MGYYCSIGGQVFYGRTAAELNRLVAAAIKEEGAGYVEKL